ncbi:hypothetical protein ERO13_A12G135150v2 [Gossypium hirsutum]|nr:hypothetical protein ERO13_A12G135150v2 [Gossypium hirsutum]
MIKKRLFWPFCYPYFIKEFTNRQAEALLICFAPFLFVFLPLLIPFSPYIRANANEEFLCQSLKHLKNDLKNEAEILDKIGRVLR